MTIHEVYTENSKNHLRAYISNVLIYSWTPNRSFRVSCVDFTTTVNQTVNKGARRLNFICEDYKLLYSGSTFFTKFNNQV